MDANGDNNFSTSNVIGFCPFCQKNGCFLVTHIPICYSKFCQFLGMQPLCYCDQCQGKVAHSSLGNSWSSETIKTNYPNDIVDRSTENSNNRVTNVQNDEHNLTILQRTSKRCVFCNTNKMPAVELRPFPPIKIGIKFSYIIHTKSHLKDNFYEIMNLLIEEITVANDDDKQNSGSNRHNCYLPSFANKKCVWCRKYQTDTPVTVWYTISSSNYWTCSIGCLLEHFYKVYCIKSADQNASNSTNKRKRSKSKNSVNKSQNADNRSQNADNESQNTNNENQNNENQSQTTISNNRNADDESQTDSHENNNDNNQNQINENPYQNIENINNYYFDENDEGVYWIKHNIAKYIYIKDSIKRFAGINAKIYNILYNIIKNEFDENNTRINIIRILLFYRYYLPDDAISVLTGISKSSWYYYKHRLL